MKKRDIQKEQNQAFTSMLVFMKFYNQNLPQGLASASAKTLKQFQQANPTLFSAKGGSASGGKSWDEWSVDKHRKRFMDWLLSQRNV